MVIFEVAAYLPQIYNTNATLIPWKAQNSSNVGQSTIVNGTYYLADQINALIHVINLTSCHQNTTITGFSGIPTNKGKGSPGSPSPSRRVPGTAGPNGIVVLPDRDEIYVGDASGVIKVINLHNNSVVANIATGGQRRADTMTYSPQSGLVLAVNPLEYPRQTPFIAVIDVASRRVVGIVSLANDVSFTGQPAWNSVTNKFYVPIRATMANPGGEINEINAASLKVTNVTRVNECHPTDIAFGPSQHLFVGCSHDQIPTYGYGFSLILDMGSNGTMVGNISGLSGVGQVVYSASTNLYYAATYHESSATTTVTDQSDGDSTNSSIPEVAIVDAKRNTLLQTIPTDNETAQTVAVDMRMDQMVVPLENEGIAVFNVGSNSTLPKSDAGSRIIRQDIDTAESGVSVATALSLYSTVSIALFWALVFCS
ncbi:hypothetical protein UA08_07416 [Talaromyces atroroseus]|uniref:SMP-30/Gluconolactonase/LRE-like region domain-containing protein n=1 Tax=Talaromyces atroroseus TaxID=1441469 RepID=A0A225ARJ1_TALAT|nr:hypothetical protein UA08_07416 [Talaromyces atroroseus]OKL57065.1 hypothetical protein UA08_07416 [Talaromyces atroroseus]